MRTILPTLLAALTLGFVATPAVAQNGPKLAYINSQRILAEAPGAQAARQALERDMQRYQSELQKLEDEIRKMITDYEQQQAMLAPEARRQREEAIQQKRAAYQQRAMQLEQEAGKRQQELVEPVMQRIQGVIDQIRQEGNYAMIFDAAAGALITADPALDLTDQVLARLKTTANQDQGR